MSGLITDYLGAGLAADRPVTPAISTGSFAQYLATDTGEVTYWDGSAWIPLGTAYSVPMGFGPTPGSSEILLIHTFAEAVAFANDFAGCQSYCGTHPTTSFALDVQQSIAGGAPSSVGTLTFSTGGVLTAVTAGGALSFDPGDTILIIGPSSADATVANTAVTLKGVRS